LAALFQLDSLEAVSVPITLWINPKITKSFVPFISLLFNTIFFKFFQVPLADSSRPNADLHQNRHSSVSEPLSDEKTNTSFTDWPNIANRMPSFTRKSTIGKDSSSCIAKK
jgi:hypothetical protein